MPKLDIQGEARLRLEEDWDSRTPAGAKRPDRARATIRMRLAGTLDLGDGFRLMGDRIVPVRRRFTWPRPASRSFCQPWHRPFAGRRWWFNREPQLRPRGLLRAGMVRRGM